MFGRGVWRLGSVSDPFAGLLYLQRDINRLFSDIDNGNDYPAVNVLLGEHDAVITAELPGLDTGKTDISVAGDVVTFSGSREPTVLGEGESYHIHERTNGRFSRQVQVPFQIDATRVEAKYEKGVLSITLPRAEEDKPKKISIKSE